MARLICKKHKRRSQVSEFDGINNIPIVRILHRSDTSRCDGDTVSFDGTEITPESLLILRLVYKTGY